MATLESFASSPVVVSRNDDLRRIIITGGVLTINGALDALPDNGSGWSIICRSGGGIRSTSGATGRLGGGLQALTIREQMAGSDGSLSWTNCHRYAQDNGKTGTNGNNSRFAGNATNQLIYDNIVWIIEGSPGDDSLRSDFDIGRGGPTSSATDGTGGSGVEFHGVHVIQQAATGDTANFNHNYSQNCKLRINPRLGFALKISNYTNGHAFNQSTVPGTLYQGLVLENLTAVNNNAEPRMVCEDMNGRTYTFDNLDTPSITEVDNNSANTVVLNNPVGVPTRGANWNAYGSTMIINRDVTFDFSGAANASGTLYADSQAASNGLDANTSISSAGDATIRLRTGYNPYTGNTQGGTWTSTDSYRFHAVGFGFAKYYSGTTNISVGNTPATRNVSLTAIAMPDGTALSSKTSGAIETATDLVNALHSYEVANPTYPSLATRLLSIANGVVQINTAQIVLSTSASDFITRSSNTITIQTDSGGIDASNGVTLLNAGTSYNVPSGTKNLIGFPLRDSTGTSALINMTAPASWYGSVFTSAGVQLGVNSFSSAGTHGFAIPANQALANTKVGCGRAGYPTQSRNLDISAGGTFNVEFLDLPAEVDANGNALYDSSVNKPGVSFIQSGNNSGQATFLIGNQSYSPKGLYRALHDQYSNPLGARFAAFGRQNLQILELGGAIPPAVFLGTDIQLRRSSSSGDNAAVNAFVLGGISGDKINSDRGPIETGGSISTGSGGGSVDLTPVTNAIAAVKADTAIAVEQNKLTMQNLPRHFYSPWVPENPAVFFVYGQLRLHDVNKRNWAIENPDGNLVINQDGDGYGTFDGSTLVRASLNRENAQGTLVNFAEECTAAFRIKPIDEDGTFIIAELGAMRLNLVMSDGTGTLQVGSVGAQNYAHATITAGMQHDIILTFQRNTRDGASSYPIVRLSASNGYADDNSNSPNVQTLQAWNVDTNEVFGAIASHTGYFNFGHSGGSGFKGEMSNVYFHPSATAINYTWEVGSHAQAAGFNVHKQIWHGLPCDSSEGLSDDLLEETAEDTNGKVNEIPQNTAAAVASRSLAGQTASKDGLLGERIKWITDNLNADDTATIVDAFYNEGASDHDEADSFGAVFNAISDIPTNTYTVPTAAQNASAVWSATTSSNNTDGSMGHRLQETSTHGAPADAPEATDIAEAVRDIAISGAAANSLGATIAAIPTAIEVREEIMDYAVETGVSYLEAYQAMAAALGGKSTPTGDVTEFKSLGGGDTVRLRTTVGAAEGERTASVIPDE